MIHDTPKNHVSQYVLVSPERGKQISLAEDNLTPDWNAYPWAGILRSMYWAYRRDLPSLAEIALQQFKREAQRDSHE